MDLNELCVGCLGFRGSVKSCSLCGWDDETEPDSPLHLPSRTILAEKYLIGRVLGQGGFGITYLAWDTYLERKLAVKEFFPRDFCYRETGDSTVSIYSGTTNDKYDYGLEKFLEEAKTLARFDGHPNIITVKDFFKANGTAYLVMNYLEGCTLKDFLQQRGSVLNFEEALGVVLPVMDALELIHSKGMLHRDVSPDNIFITTLGSVILLDFGAARHALGESAKNLSIILKPGYAPEEQYRSKGQQGAWTDIYAVAATFYHAITGKMPPESLDRLAEDSLILPSSIGIEISNSAEQALVKALAVRAADRFQTIEQFRDAIWSLQPEGTVSTDYANSYDESATYVEPALQDYESMPVQNVEHVVQVESGYPADIVINIGRDFSNDLVLSDNTVSRFHATVYRQAGKWYLSDRNSTHGTYLDNNRIEDVVELTGYARIGLGQAYITFDGANLLDESGAIVEVGGQGVASAKTFDNNNTFTSSTVNDVQVERPANKSPYLYAGMAAATFFLVGIFFYIQFGSTDDSVSVPETATEPAVVQETSVSGNDDPEEAVVFDTIDFKGGQYTGELKGGLPHGQGRWVYKTGSESLSYGAISSSGQQVYEGEWKDGKKHGEGRMTFPSGVTQSGLWENDNYKGAN